MKTEIGGGRIGSGNKMNVSFKNYSRSTHDLSETFRSSMAVGTLVPFLKKVALPGDTWDIDLAADIVTLPTVGPLFGSFKLQMDVFQVPMRIYNAMLHMNRKGIGNDMSSVLFPLWRLQYKFREGEETDLAPNAQVNPSSLAKYLGISGIGRSNGDTGLTRDFNAIPMLGYFDIVKNFYVNNMEDKFYVIHTDDDTIGQGQEITAASIFNSESGSYEGNCYNNEVTVNNNDGVILELAFPAGAEEPDPTKINILVNQSSQTIAATFGTTEWDTSVESIPRLICSNFGGWASGKDLEIEPQAGEPLTGWDLLPKLQECSIDNFDAMRMAILQHTPLTTPFAVTDALGLPPYGNERKIVTVDGHNTFSVQYPMENLAVKTYQSDLFNNWINTEWLDGQNGVNAVTAVDTTGDSFTIDALNLAKKVYIMLNRIAISGGTYDDWLDAVYEHERPRSMEEPIYHGSLIKEISFEEVISNAATSIDGVKQPLGELGGRGRLTNKHKGGKMVIKVHEPSYIMGIVSITPRIEYSQGNEFDMNLRNMNEMHKPQLDGIGFQELITEQMDWRDTEISANDTFTLNSAGKQPAWINYMTSVDKSYGNFAVGMSDDFMVLNREYESDANGLQDLTTYIDPSKWNGIFAQQDITAQNFWVHIGKKMEVRRKMSAKVIPNL